MAIQYERIKKTIAALAAYGTLPQGGTTRLSYTAEYLAAQAFLQREMLESGMLAEVDPIGNLIGTYVGREPELTAVMSGSHLDTVRQAEILTELWVSSAALECVRSWQEEGYRPKRTVQVIATIEEECTAFGMACFGVRVRGGEFKKQQPESIVHLTGGSLAECLQAAGLPHSALQDAAVGFQDLAAFVELHIEQGADLEERGLTCGAVTAIVGYDRLFLTLHGEANHAGTTSMRRRRDALAAAAEVILGVKELAEADDRFVATVGQLNVAPNAVNIVPGKVQLAIETRAADDRVLAEVRAKIMSLLERTASKSGVVITKENDFHVAAVPLSESVRKVIEQSAAECGVSFQAMPSWAGHDAQIFAASGVPTGMIFVPSINGVSHSKEESSDFQSVTQAVKVLEKTLKTLAEV